MSAKKNASLLLSKEELKEFKAFLKNNKITQQDLADTVSMSKSACGDAIRESRVPQAWARMIYLKFENIVLKEKLKNIEETIKK